jgi:hypothetical protein
MKSALTVLAMVGMLTTARSALAVESPKDVETDHVDAKDDGGPHSVGVLIHPVAMATGWYGGEVDAAVNEHGVLSVEGEGSYTGLHGVHVAFGGAYFSRRSFRGFYIRNTVDWARVAADGVAASGLGTSFTLGYAWTWSVGPTLRLGGGVRLAYHDELVGAQPSPLAFNGVGLKLDADLGWVF